MPSGKTIAALPVLGLKNCTSAQQTVSRAAEIFAEHRFWSSDQFFRHNSIYNQGHTALRCSDRLQIFRTEGWVSEEQVNAAKQFAITQRLVYHMVVGFSREFA